jgi:hypothetical protein
MARSVIRMLIVLIVALATAMPAGALVMPAAGTATHMAGMAADQPCQNCPQPDQPGGTSPDKMPGCPALACMTAPAVLPSPTLLPGHVVFPAEYAWPATALLTGTEPVLDPFPPRPALFL